MSEITLRSLVWEYLMQRKWAIIGLFVVSMLWAIEMSLSPYLLKVVIDRVTTYKGPVEGIAKIILIPSMLYVAVSFVIDIVFRIYDYISLKLYPDMKAYFERKLLSHLLNHSFTFFQNTYTGTLTKKITDLMENLEPLISIPNEWFYPRILAAIVAGVTLYFAVHPIFSVILIAWTILFVIVSYSLSRRAEGYSKKLAKSGTTLAGIISDALSNVISVKLFNSIRPEQKRIDKQLDQVVHDDRSLRWYNLFVNFVLGLSITLLFAAMFSALLFGTNHGWVTSGDFALVLTLSSTFAWSVHAVGQQVNQFFKTIGVCNASISFLKEPHEIVDPPKAKRLKVTRGEIQFKQVHFQYENSPPVFSELDLHIKPGEKVGLVGYSGGGKSTLIKLLLRLVDIQSGEITIDGQNVKKVSQGSLHDQVGVIPQEPGLFHRTIMDNIRFAKPSATDAEVIEAAKKAHCHDFILSTPGQYNAMVGDRGLKISGGQKQRIAIARAFLKNAPILLLDEATSALDSVTEQKIHDALHEVMENKTTLVIAHRLATLKDMSRILVFDKGKIVEDDRLSALLNNQDGLFYHLWQMQAKGFM